MAKLKHHEHGPTLSREDRSVMAPIGWLGASGEVYPITDHPIDGREPGGFSPLYISVGVWEYLGDDRWGVKD